jgi:hypothetical protein
VNHVILGGNSMLSFSDSFQKSAMSEKSNERQKHCLCFVSFSSSSSSSWGSRRVFIVYKRAVYPTQYCKESCNTNTCMHRHSPYASCGNKKLFCCSDSRLSQCFFKCSETFILYLSFFFRRSRALYFVVYIFLFLQRGIDDDSKRPRGMSNNQQQL